MKNITANIFNFKGNLVTRILIKSPSNPKRNISETHRAIILLQSRSPSATFTGEQKNKNVTGDSEQQQNSAHCPAPSNATTLAQEGTRGGLQRTAVWRSRRSHRRLRRQRLSAIHRPRNVPEPSDLPKASLASRRRIRLRNARSSGASVRWIGFRRSSPSRCSLRVDQLAAKSESHWFAEAMRWRYKKEPRVFRRIESFTVWICW